MKKTLVIMVILIIFSILAMIGEVMCIIKAVRCNWDPVGKAEIVYTAGALTGLGALVGWFDIQDK